MSKAIMISISPSFCEKIAAKKCSITIKKTRPKFETPFKCYIYESQGGKKVIGEFVCDKIIDWEYKDHIELIGGLGLVRLRASYMCFLDDLEKSCLTYDDLLDYGKGKTLYGWHISDLKIYDNSKKLSDFGQKCKYAKYQDDEMYGGWFCGNEYIECDWQDCPSCGGESCGYEDYAYCMCNGLKPLTRPPQSWCYVEEEK